MRTLRSIVALLGLAPLTHAVSFGIAPWITILEPHKNNFSQVITLKYIGDETKRTDRPNQEGPGNAPIPVELTIFPRFVNEDGDVKYSSDKSSPEFTLFPAQLILYPGDEQRVQLQWVYDKIPDREITFGLIAAQLPVAIEDDGAKYNKAVGLVNILTRYETIVVVRPAGVKSKIKVDSAYAGKDSSGAPELVLVLSNQGTGMQSTKDMKLQIHPIGANGKADFARKILYTPELPLRAAKHAIFSGGRRRFHIPWPEKFPLGPIQVTAEFP